MHGMFIDSRRMVSFEEAFATLERIRKRFDEPSSRVPEAIRAGIEFKIGSLHWHWGCCRARPCIPCIARSGAEPPDVAPTPARVHRGYKGLPCRASPR